MIKIDTGFFGEYKDLKELKDKALEFLKNNFKGIAVINKKTDFAIRFNSRSFGKLLYKSGVLKTQVLSSIKEVVEKAEFVSSEADKNKNSKVIAVLLFKVKVEIKGYEYDYYFNVKHTKDGKYIYAGMMDIEKKKKVK